MIKNSSVNVLKSKSHLVFLLISEVFSGNLELSSCRLSFYVVVGILSKAWTTSD